MKREEDFNKFSFSIRTFKINCVDETQVKLKSSHDATAKHSMQKLWTKNQTLAQENQTQPSWSNIYHKFSITHQHFHGFDELYTSLLFIIFGFHVAWLAWHFAEWDVLKLLWEQNWLPLKWTFRAFDSFRMIKDVNWCSATSLQSLHFSKWMSRDFRTLESISVLKRVFLCLTVAKSIITSY